MDFYKLSPDGSFNGCKSSEIPYIMSMWVYVCGYENEYPYYFKNF